MHRFAFIRYRCAGVRSSGCRPRGGKLRTGPTHETPRMCRQHKLLLLRLPKLRRRRLKLLIPEPRTIGDACSSRKRTTLTRRCGASGDQGPSSAGAGCPGTSRDSSAEPGPQDACVWRPASPSPQPTALERRRAQAVLRQRRAEQTRRGRSVIRVRSDACDSCLRYLCLMCVLIRPCTMSVLHSHRARTHVTHYSGETERYKLACAGGAGSASSL